MSVSVGEKVTGKITGITNFGAFVDLGNHQTGLVHISEVANGFVKDVNDVLSVGDEVKVKVLAMNGNKISLSIKQADEVTVAPKPKPRPVRTQQTKTNNNSKGGFDDLLSGFLKESESRLSTLKKNTEGKRGGRGGRRH